MDFRVQNDLCIRKSRAKEKAEEKYPSQKWSANKIKKGLNARQRRPRPGLN